MIGTATNGEVRISVIIPTHDRPSLVQRAIASARTAGTGVEVVVVDDASTDDTRAICSSMPGIRYVRLDQRRGVGGARQAGLQESTGELLSFLDDDDVRLPGSLDRQIAALEAHPHAGLVYGPVYLGTQDHNRTERVMPAQCIGGDVFWPLLNGNFVPAISAVFRRSALVEAGGLRAELAPCDDWDLWVRIAEVRAVVAVQEPVAVWREPTLWSGQGSSRVADGLLPSSLRASVEHAKLARVLSDPEGWRRARASYRTNMTNRLMKETLEAVGRRDVYAVRSLNLALRLFPMTVARMLLAPRAWKYLRTMLRTGAA